MILHGRCCKALGILDYVGRAWKTCTSSKSHNYRVIYVALMARRGRGKEKKEKKRRKKKKEVFIQGCILFIGVAKLD
jgi:hypothetical protein